MATREKTYEITGDEIVRDLATHEPGDGYRIEVDGKTVYLKVITREEYEAI